jgi:cobalt/nickel transport system ATP-binding protein
VLLLDEPTAGLDPRSQSQTIDLLAGWKDTGRTVVTATHDLDSVEEIADDCFVFEAGRLVAQGAPEAMLGDVDLLRRTGLLHAHTHIHPHHHHDHAS